MSALGLVWANLGSRPMRTWLTLLSVTIAFVLFTLLRTVANWFDGDTLEGVSNARLVVAPKYSSADQLPIRLWDRIRGVDGVEAVTHQTWFGGVYQDPGNAFPKIAVEPRPHFAVFADNRIDPAVLERFANTRTGVVVSDDMLERFGWRVGDRIPIQADIWPMRDGGRLWEFDLVGSFSWSDKGQSLMLLNYGYFDAARQFGEGSVGWYSVQVDDPKRTREVSRVIDEMFDNSANPTETVTEREYYRAFLSQIGDIGLLTTGILFAVFFTILLLAGVTMNQAFRERIAELAVLKTLGFADARVALVVLAESVGQCVGGGLLGIFGTLAIEVPLNDVLVRTGIGVFDVSGELVAVGIALALLLGIAAGAGPAWTAHRLGIADALRRGN